MKPSLALWLALIGLALVTIAAMKANGAERQPMLIDAAARPTCFVNHPCTRMDCTRRIA